jgi:hypothetical protein
VPAAAIATPGAQGFDSDTTIDQPAAAALKEAGFAFAIRYLSRLTPQAPGDLSYVEAQTILNAGLALMAVQHVSRPGWAPSAALGANYGDAAVANAVLIGLPRGICLWLDLEEVAPYATAGDTIAYVNAWAAVVTNGSFVPGLYVGANQPLSGDELYWRLRIRNYWKSASTVPDIPYRGYQIMQALAPSPIGGIALDRDVVLADNFGGLPYWAIG